MPSPAGRYTRSGLCDEVVGMGFCPIFGIWQGAGAPATSQMRCWLLPNGRIFPAVAGILCVAPPEREDFPRRSGDSLRWTGVLHLYFPALPPRWRNVGFFCRAAHALAVGAEIRAQRRHAPHGALRVLDTPAGSIGTIFSVVGRSAPTALFRQMRRSPLLFRNDTKIPVCLRVSTLFRI